MSEAKVFLSKVLSTEYYMVHGSIGGADKPASHPNNIYVIGAYRGGTLKAVYAIDYAATNESNLPYRVQSSCIKLINKYNSDVSRETVGC